MNFLEEPARKLFISQCSKLRLPESVAQENQKSKCWNFFCKSKIFSVGKIWIQGIIVNVSKSSEPSFQIDDGTGIAMVKSVTEAPGYSSSIYNGQYAMVIGEVLSIEPSIEIRTLKLTRLPEPNSESVWNLEVQDFWRFLLS